MEFIQGPRNVKILYDGKPLRIQTPKMRACNVYEYGTLEFEAPEAFVQKWSELEDACKEHADMEWRSNLVDGKFRVKMDDRTHIFDEDSRLVHNVPELYNRFVVCIVEVKSVYRFKGFCGVTCRIHQMKVYSNTYCFCDDAESGGGDS